MGRQFRLSARTVSTAQQCFYRLNSFSRYDKYVVATASLFLASKLADKPRALKNIIKIFHTCLYPRQPRLLTGSQAYMAIAERQSYYRPWIFTLPLSILIQQFLHVPNQLEPVKPFSGPLTAWPFTVYGLRPSAFSINHRS